MNLKELTKVKELADESLEKIAYALELVLEELDPGPDHPEGVGDGEPVREAADDDGGVDPLEDVRVALIHAHDLVGAILDCTEPHRKRYAVASRSGNSAGNTAGNTVAGMERQTSVPGTTPVLTKKGGTSNGTSDATPRRKGSNFRRP